MIPLTTSSKTAPVAMHAASLAKASTGIVGPNEITGGDRPQGRTTLLVAGPLPGKTIFGAQCLGNGARHCQEPGLFAAFEEGQKRIAVNFEGFDWAMDARQPGQRALALDPPEVATLALARP
jgi:KaiC/GvpD/RAD55 family RecA-like ATPase